MTSSVWIDLATACVPAWIVAVGMAVMGGLDLAARWNGKSIQFDSSSETDEDGR